MRYVFREKMISVRDVFDIKDENGDVAYTMTSRLLALRQTFVLEKPDGSNVAVVKKQWLRPWDQYKIRFSSGGSAKIRRAFFRFSFGPRFIIKTSRGRVVADGNFLAREYDFERAGKKIAAASRHWIAMTDTYGIDIFEPDDAPLVLSCVVVIDAFAAQQEKNEKAAKANKHTM